jgi:hypothetical protein
MEQKKAEIAQKYLKKKTIINKEVGRITDLSLTRTAPAMPSKRKRVARPTTPPPQGQPIQKKWEPQGSLTYYIDSGFTIKDSPWHQQR